MGNYIGYHVEARLRDKEVTPKFETNITFDPKLGFEEPRKERGRKLYILCVCSTKHIYHTQTYALPETSFPIVFLCHLYTVMIATEAEMDAAMIKPEDRGYCAHLLIAYKQCAHDCYPFAWRCHHEKHDYLNCKFEE